MDGIKYIYEPKGKLPENLVLWHESECYKAVLIRTGDTGMVIGAFTPKEEYDTAKLCFTVDGNMIEVGAGDIEQLN